MQRVQRILVMTATFVVGLTPVLALTEPTIEEREDNRRLLEKWQTDPEHMARLQQNLAAFRALPPEKQDRLRHLDRALSKEDQATRTGLLAALERYKAWLTQLPEAERNEILAAPNTKERLQLIRRIRTKEWIARLPAADKKKLRDAPDPAARLALIQHLRQEEHQRRDEWQIARRFWNELLQGKPLPSKLEDFPRAVNDFVNQNLMRLLNDEEKKRLDSARGHWPLYPRTLVELAARHPLAIPGPIGPTRLADLDLRKLKLNPVKVQGSLLAVEGQWPEFGIVLRREIQLSHKKGDKKSSAIALIESVLPNPYTPSKPEHFSPAIQQFLAQELIPALEKEDLARLDTAKGRWPDYPRTIAALARKYRLQVPEMTLPDRAYWDRYRPQSVIPDAAASGPIPVRRDWLINRLPE